MNPLQHTVKRTGFYPASARDYLEPLQLLKDWVDHLIFCDMWFGPQGRQQLRQLRETASEAGLPEPSFFLGDAIAAMACLKPVDVFFLRGDSGGEGGSGLFLLGPDRLPFTLSLIKPNGMLITDKPNGFRWLPPLTSGDVKHHQVGDRVITLNESQPWTEQRLFALTVA